jgi:hypothetical protein
VEVAKAVPPLEAAYHFIFVPLADKFATVGLALVQNDWEVVPVGAEGAALIVTVIVLLHPLLLV